MMAGARGLRRVPVPRLLPITMVGMVVLLGMKAEHVVRAVLPPAAASASAPAKGEAPVKVESPPAKPAGAHGGATPEPAPAVKPVAVEAKPSPPPQEPAVSPQERALLLDLRRRNGELQARDTALAAREAALSAAEKRLATRLDELAALQKRLEDLEAARRARDEANWQGLVKTYETMKPRDAAAILNDLDKQVLLQVLDRMKEARAAPILAAMQPERARLVTAELAEKRVKENAAPGAAPQLAKATPQTPGTK